MINMIGKKYGRLTVIEFAGIDKNHSATWKCLCECGETKILDGRLLRYGKVKSCGCLDRERHITNPNRLRHGMCKTRIYNIWTSIKSRCNNKNDPLYGGRNISVCKEWKDFEPFYEWAIKTGYDDTKSIDRIDVNGDYSPENCRWADITTQANNRRNNHPITINGETRNITQWAKLYGVSYQSVWKRMKKGISGEDLFLKRGGDKP